MQLRAGIYPSRHPEQTDGWRILCEQEKTPYFLTTERPDCPVLLCEGETPVWLPDYLQEGGIAVLSGKSLRERAEAMAAIAHPDFREKLMKYARENFR